MKAHSLRLVAASSAVAIFLPFAPAIAQAAPAPQEAASPTVRAKKTKVVTYVKVQRFGTVSVAALGTTDLINKGQIVNGEGVLTAGNWEGTFTNVKATKTRFTAAIEAEYSGRSYTLLANFKGKNFRYTGTTTGDVEVKFTNLKVKVVKKKVSISSGGAGI